MITHPLTAVPPNSASEVDAMVEEIFRRAHRTGNTTWGGVLPTNKTVATVSDASAWSRIVYVVVDEDDADAAASLGTLQKTMMQAAPGLDFTEYVSSEALS